MPRKNEKIETKRVKNGQNMTRRKVIEQRQKHWISKKVANKQWTIKQIANSKHQITNNKVSEIESHG